MCHAAERRARLSHALRPDGPRKPDLMQVSHRAGMPSRHGLRRQDFGSTGQRSNARRPVVTQRALTQTPVPHRKSTCGSATMETSSALCSNGQRPSTTTWCSMREQVTIAFSRPGRIDLSAHNGSPGGGWWWTPGPRMAMRQPSVTLRVLPDARVRSFDLKDGRVAVDLFSGTAAQSPAPARTGSGARYHPGAETGARAARCGDRAAA